MKPILFALPLLLVLGACAHKHPMHSKAPAVKAAVANLAPTAKNKVTGTVRFTQMEGYVLVKAELKGLTPGKHGFHIHEFGDCSAADGTSAGGHFNPAAQGHGAPEGQVRHTGDLGNLLADAKGNASLEWQDKQIRFHGPQSILGRAVIVHEKEDDLTTQPTGNAGARQACGVIGAVAAH